jgi:hypothetical protein
MHTHAGSHRSQKKVSGFPKLESLPVVSYWMWVLVLCKSSKHSELLSHLLTQNFLLLTPYIFNISTGAGLGSFVRPGHQLGQGDLGWGRADAAVPRRQSKPCFNRHPCCRVSVPGGSSVHFENLHLTWGQGQVQRLGLHLLAHFLSPEPSNKLDLALEPRSECVSGTLPTSADAKK